MNELKKLAIEALVTGLIDSDENGSVSFEIFGVTHTIKVKQSELDEFEATILANEEAALQEIEDAELVVQEAKKVIEKAESLRLLKEAKGKKTRS